MQRKDHKKKVNWGREGKDSGNGEQEEMIVVFWKRTWSERRKVGCEVGALAYGLGVRADENLEKQVARAQEVYM